MYLVSLCTQQAVVLDVPCATAGDSMGQDAVFQRTLQGMSHTHCCLYTAIKQNVLPQQKINCCLPLLQDTRLEDYRNYLNLKDEVDAHQEELVQECLSVQKVICTSQCTLRGVDTGACNAACSAACPALLPCRQALHIWIWAGTAHFTVLYRKC